MFDTIRSLFARSTTPGRDDEPSSESDVGRDDGLANSRAAGGRHRSDGDSPTTTGTGDSEVFVGRVAGQDEGYAGETGAEARADEERDA